MEHQTYVRALKRCLRAKHITYSDLALRLKMSESGVKKMLNAKDLSFRRIVKICDMMRILPGELFTLAEKSAIPTLTLSTRQEDALIHDRKLLAFYWNLVIEKRSLLELQSVLKITPAQSQARLRELDRLELITLRKGQVHLPFTGKFKWPDDSRLARLLNRDGSMLALERALSNQPDLNAQHRLMTIQLSPDAFRQFQLKLTEVFDEAARTSERQETTLNSADLRQITGLFATVQKGIF